MEPLCDFYFARCSSSDPTSRALKIKYQNTNSSNIKKTSESLPFWSCGPWKSILTSLHSQIDLERTLFLTLHSFRIHVEFSPVGVIQRCHILPNHIHGPQDGWRLSRLIQIQHSALVTVVIWNLRTTSKPELWPPPRSTPRLGRSDPFSMKEKWACNYFSKPLPKDRRLEPQSHSTHGRCPPSWQSIFVKHVVT